MDGAYNWLNSKNIKSPVVGYNPEHMLKWKKAKSEPVAGFVISKSNRVRFTRGFYVPASIRSGVKIIKADLTEFTPTSSQPSWYIRPGSSTPIRAIDGVLTRTKQKVQYVPEHIILERPLPDSAHNEYHFVPDFCVPNVITPTFESLPLHVNYVPAFPEAVLGASNRVSISRSPAGLNDWLREETRLRGQCSPDVSLNHNNESSGWGLFNHSMMDAFFMVFSVMVLHRMVTNWFS